MRLKGRAVLLTLGAAHSLNHSSFLVLPALIPLIVKTGATIETVSLVTSPGFLMYGVGSLLGGMLADRFGEGRVVVLSTGLSGASLLIIYARPDVTGLAVGFLLMAVWASFYHPTANSLVSKLFASGVGSAMGIHGAAGSLGQILAPTLAVVVALGFGWPSAFLVFGLFAIVNSILLTRLPSTVAKPRMKWGTVWAAFKNRWVLALLVYNTLQGMVFSGVQFVLPTFLVEEKGFSVQSAGMAISVLLAFGVFGQLLGGKPVDKIGAKRFVVISTLGALVGIAALVSNVNMMLSVAVFLVSYGIFFYALQPACNALAASMVNAEIRGVFFGIMFFLGFSVGAPAVALAGRLSYTFSSTLAVEVMGGFLVVALLTAFALPQTRSASSSSVS